MFESPTLWATNYCMENMSQIVLRTRKRGKDLPSKLSKLKINLSWTNRQLEPKDSVSSSEMERTISLTWTISWNWPVTQDERLADQLWQFLKIVMHLPNYLSSKDLSQIQLENPTSFKICCLTCTRSRVWIGLYDNWHVAVWMPSKVPPLKL